MEPVERACTGTYWISILLGTAIDTPFVVAAAWAMQTTP